MNSVEYMDEVEELQEIQCKYKVTMLGLIHADEEKIESFLSAEKVYVRVLRKMIRYLKQEISSAEAIKNSILSNDKEDKSYDH